MSGAIPETRTSPSSDWKAFKEVFSALNDLSLTEE